MVYRIYRRTLMACCLVVGVGCSSAPATSPSGRLVSVEVSEKALSLGRTESASVKAFATYANGSKEDVTSVASWSTSTESPVQVTGGVVTGRSIGRGRVVATFGGLSATADVAVHRRTEIGGAVTVSCEPTARILAGLQAQLDDAVIGRVDVGSDHSAERTMQLSFSGVSVSPGAHALKVSILRFGFLSAGAEASVHTFAAVPPPVLVIRDRDTHEDLSTLALSMQEVAIQNSGAFSWQLEIPEFTE